MALKNLKHTKNAPFFIEEQEKAKEKARELVKIVKNSIFLLTNSALRRKSRTFAAAFWQNLNFN